MKRKCTLDLRFHRSSGYSLCLNEPLNMNKKLLAILHSRRHTFDMTEFQARVIIWLASQEMEERNGRTGPAPTPSFSFQPHALLMPVQQGFSIKKSIRSFLQKRKKRSQSHITITTHSSTN